MKNDYEVRGDVTAIFLRSKKFGYTETLISTSKLDRAKEFPNSWCLLKNTDSLFYVIGHLPVKDGKRKDISLHRWITNAPKNLIVDHINHDTLRNTDDNLRFVTNAENGQNRRGASVNSSSGVRGVSWSNTYNKWRSGFKMDGKFHHVGMFDNIDDAEIAVMEARKKFMPYSPEASTL